MQNLRSVVMENSRSKPLEQDAAPTCVPAGKDAALPASRRRRLRLRPYVDEGLMVEADRTCILAGIHPGEFLERALRMALEPENLTRIKQAYDAEQARRYRERLAKRTIYRHRNLL